MASLIPVSQMDINALRVQSDMIPGYLKPQDKHDHLLGALVVLIEGAVS